MTDNSKSNENENEKEKNDHKQAIEDADKSLGKLKAVNDEVDKKEATEGLSEKESKLHSARKKLYDKSKNALDDFKNQAFSGNNNNQQPLNLTLNTSDIPGASIVEDSYKLAKNTVDKAIDKGGELINEIVDESIGEMETLLEESVGANNPETVKDYIVDTAKMFPLTSEHLANKIGIDLLRPESAAHQISEVNKTLDNPDVQEQLKEGVGVYSKVAAAALDSTKPVTDEVIDIYANTAQQIGDEMGETAVKVGLNTLQSIPGVGAAVGIVRDVGNIADATYNITQISHQSNSAVSQALDTTDSALKEKLHAIKEYEKKTTDLFEEKEHIEDRTQKSIDNHMNSSQGSNNKTNNQLGGKKRSKTKTKRRRKIKWTRKNKYKINKSKHKKRVRFSFKKL